MRAAVSVLLLSGCVSWETTEIASPDKVPANRVITVWTRSGSVRWKSVQVTPDSLSGVPTTASNSCSTCRVSIHISTVDSTKSQSSNALPVILATAPFVFLIVSLMSYDSGPTTY
jgi:hypothetical protein